MDNKKTIIITKSVHDRLKIYCDNKRLKLGGFVDQIIIDFLDKEQK